MDSQEFDQALSLVGDVYQLKDINKFPEKKYLFLCFESEILYYNALFDLGADKAKEAILFVNKQLQGDSLKLGNAYNLLGINAENIEPLYQVIELYQNSLKVLPDHRDPLYSNIAHVASNLGQLYAQEKKVENAKKWLHHSNQFALRDSQFRTVSINYETLSKVALAEKNNALAKIMLDSCLFYQKLRGDKDLLLFYYHATTAYWLALNKRDSALKAINNGRLLIEDIENINQMGVYTFLKNTRELLGENQLTSLANEFLALEEKHYQKLQQTESQAKEKIINQFNRNIQLLETQELQRLAAEKKLEKHQSTLLWLVFGFVLFVIISMAIIAIVYQKRKVDKIAFEKEKSELAWQGEVEKEKEKYNAVLNERSRISKEFHDGIAPNLSSLKIIFDTLNRKNQGDALMQQIPEIIDQTLQEIKQLLNEINPSILLNNGLENALKHFIAILANANKQTEILLTSNLGSKRYVHDIELNFYRIAQEAIQNALKHSNTPQIHISLLEQNNQLHAEIADFGTNSAILQAENDLGNGLKNMQSRAKIINGELKINSKKGEGTSIQISVSLS